MRIAGLCCIAVVSSSVLSACTEDGPRADAGSTAMEPFALTDVRLLAVSPISNAERVNLRYMHAMEPDRLLAPYLREAGLEPKAESYGNWENTGLDGHIGGHYLSALALAWAATGDEEAHERLRYMLDELERAQQAGGNFRTG